MKEIAELAEKKWITIEVPIPTLEEIDSIPFKILLFARDCDSKGHNQLAVKELRVASTYIKKALNRMRGESA